jgi:hypothetical protein
MLKWRRRGFFVAFLFVFILFFYSNLYAYKALQLDSPKVRLIIPPGKSKTGKIEVRNEADEPKKVKLSVEDWAYVDESGSKKFFPPGTEKLSCANWINYAPAEFVIPAFGKEYVNYTARVPEDAQGGHYAVLFFENVMGELPEKTDSMVVVPVAIRIGSLFYIECEGTVKRTVEFDKPVLERGPNEKPLAINVGFKNTGNVDLIVGGNFDIIDKQGMVYARGKFINDAYLFPGDTGILKANWKGSIPKNSYDLIITLDLGKALEEVGLGRGPVVVKEAEIEIGDNGEVVRVSDLK